MHLLHVLHPLHLLHQDDLPLPEDCMYLLDHPIDVGIGERW